MVITLRLGEDLEHFNNAIKLVQRAVPVLIVIGHIVLGVLLLTSKSLSSSSHHDDASRKCQ